MYSLDIFDETGELVTSTGIHSIRNSTVVYALEVALEKGHTYSAKLTIQHQHVPGEAFITFLGIGMHNCIFHIIIIIIIVILRISL